MKTKRIRFIALSLAVVMVFILAACGEKVVSPDIADSTTTNSEVTQQQGGTTSTPEQEVLPDPMEGDYLFTAFELAVAHRRESQFAVARYATIYDDLLGSDIAIVVKGNTTTASREAQYFTISMFNMIINGVTYPYYKQDFFYFSPEYVEVGDFTIHRFSIPMDEPNAKFGSEHGTYQYEMVINGVFVQSDIYTTQADAETEITITQPPARFNIYDMSYKDNYFGNSAGNSNNRGYAHQRGDWIYYTNGSDNNYLYKIRIDGTEKMKLNNEASDNINVVGDWVYYRAFESGNYYKIKTDGSEITLICVDAVENPVISNGWIYYANADDELRPYRIRLDGTDRTYLFGIEDAYGQVDSINVVGNSILYVQQGRMANIRTITADGSPIMFRNFEHDTSTVVEFIIDGDWAYLTNVLEGYKICTYRYDVQGARTLNDDPSAYINVADGWIYYCNLADNGNLYKIRTDGTGRTQVNSDSSENINVAGDWLYYENMSDNGQLYRIRTDGTERQTVT